MILTYLSKNESRQEPPPLISTAWFRMQAAEDRNICHRLYPVVPRRFLFPSKKLSEKVFIESETRQTKGRIIKGQSTLGVKKSIFLFQNNAHDEI